MRTLAKQLRRKPVLIVDTQARQLYPSSHCNLFNWYFPLPLFQIISQKDEHCWVGELNGLRGENRMGCTGKSRARCRASINLQHLLWQQRLCQVPRVSAGTKETYESSHAAVTWLLLANSKFSLHPPGTGWLGACHHCCMWVVSCNWLSCAAALVTVFWRLLASFFGGGSYEL